MQDIYNDISSSDSEEDIVTDQNKLTGSKTQTPPKELT